MDKLQAGWRGRRCAGIHRRKKFDKDVTQNDATDYFKQTHFNIIFLLVTTDNSFA